MSKGMNNIMKQAQQMQAKIMTLQKELEHRELSVSSGGGAVKININGKQEILDIKLDPECVQPTDIEMLEDLLKAAFNQATKESKDMVQNAMSKVTGGVNIPGLF